MRYSLILALILLAPGNLFAQQAKAQLFFDSKLTTRFESVDWFGSDKDAFHHNFAHSKLQLGGGYKAKSFKFYLQGQYFQLYDLSEGGAGPEAAYFETNGKERSPGKAAIRQAYIELHEAANNNLTVGRVLYSNGSEAPPANPLLTSVRSSRVMQRLIGPFDYTSGRSFDGVKGTLSANSGAFSGFFLMPTEGGFEIDQNRTMNEIKVTGLTYTDRAFLESTSKYDFQSFLYFYSDTRETVKADNRRLEIRSADTDEVELATLGAHWTKLWLEGSTTVDSLLWAAGQGGDWGNQDHRAYAYTAEIAVRKTEYAWQPAIIAGHTLGTGDDNSEDRVHETFFQILPTSRAFARIPFYNMQNTSDLFSELSFVPAETLKFRSSLHWIQLTENKDALYSGGGANKVHGGFGYNVRPSRGSHDVGTLADIEAAWFISSNYILSFYYGHLFGGDVTAASDGGDRDIDYFFTELGFRFG